MPLDEEHELSPGTVDAIRSFTGGRVQASPIGNRVLAEFVVGVAPAADRQSVIASLVGSVALRERMIVLREQLKRIRATPLGELQAAEGFDPDLIRVVLDDAGQSMTFFTSVRGWFERHGWNEVQSGLSREAKWIQSAIQSAGESLATAFSSPRFAVTRGESEGSEHGLSLPEGVTVDFDVELSSAGSLLARASFMNHADSFQGRAMGLELIDLAGGTIPLGSASIVDGSWKIEIAGFARISGLESGTVVPSIFRLALEGEEVPGSPYSRLYAIQEPVSVEVVEPPRIEDGQLIVTLALPSSRRRSEDAFFELLAPVGSSLQLLGRWPMRDWTEDVQTFRIALPATADGVLEAGSVLHARISEDS